MVSGVEDLDVILTQTEQEALILEATQIKAHKPRYNINLKDDKKYSHTGSNRSARQMRMMLDVMHRT